MRIVLQLHVIFDYTPPCREICSVDSNSSKSSISLSPKVSQVSFWTTPDLYWFFLRTRSQCQSLYLILCLPE